MNPYGYPQGVPQQQYPQQISYGTPQQGYAGNTLTEPFTFTDKSLPMAGSPQRDVADFDKYAFDLLKEKVLKKPVLFENQTPAYYYKGMVLMNMYLLFNGIITIMTLANQFGTKNLVDQTLLNVATYLPLGFFLMYFLLFDNYFSEQVYYHYLRYGAIVDFPQSNSYGSMFTNARPLLFILAFLGYVFFMLYFFFKNGGQVSDVWVWLSNAIIGVFMFWYRNLSIESRFISLSDYIQSFPDKNNKRGINIDLTNLNEACKTLQDSVLLDANENCYTGAMRAWWWGPDHERETGISKLGHFLVILLIIVGAVVGSIFMLDSSKSNSAKIEWDTRIKPCVQACLMVSSNCTTCLFNCRLTTNSTQSVYCQAFQGAVSITCANGLTCTKM